MDRKHRKNEWQKRHYRESPGVAERMVDNARNWNATNPFRYTVSQLRYRAKKKGITFDLDADHLRSIMPADGLCPILRIPLTLPCQGNRAGVPTDDAVSVDRNIPERGYIRGNVTIMSAKANRMKNDCTDAEAFERLAEHVRKYCHSITPRSFNAITAALMSSGHFSGRMIW